MWCRGFSNRIGDGRVDSRPETGFTLIELLIVTAVIPIIVGALSAGLLAVFSLQSSASTRLADTADSQVVAASFEPDVQSAQEITTAASSSPDCVNGSQTQVLGMEWNLDVTTGFYENVVSYVTVANGSGTDNLIRNVCTGNGSQVISWANAVTTSSSNLSFNVPLTQPLPVISCESSVTTANCNLSSTQYIPTSGVTNVQYVIDETKGTTESYTYTLISAPAASASAPDTGAPVTAKSTTSCGNASNGSGTYANTLCFVDFAPLTGGAMLAATAANHCLEMSAALPGNFTLFFCINISGGQVAPYQLPTYPEAFLGNSVGGIPFYTNVPGSPALYQDVQGGTTTITFSNITVLSPTGEPATGWEATSADAESSDANESITWTTGSTGPDLTVIPNNLPSEDNNVPTAGVTSPVGNACNSGDTTVNTNGYLSGNGTQTVVCNGGTGGAGDTSNGVQKTGAAMVEATTPNALTVTMVGTGLQGITFGLLLS